MGKRSNFERIDRDYYPTPEKAVLPLIDHLPKSFTYWEPCAGDGRLISHITKHRPASDCLLATDLDPKGEGISQDNALDVFPEVMYFDYIITNPPWSRDVLHPMIKHFCGIAPTWLLFDADWVHTRQAVPYLSYLRKIVAVGRVKWIEGSKQTGKDNCAWHLFDYYGGGRPVFYGRTQSTVASVENHC